MIALLHLCYHYYLQVDLDSPMKAVLLSQLSQYSVRTRISLTGHLIVAKDITHAKLLDQLQSRYGLQITSNSTQSITKSS